ncbi:hypothetical protein [Arthrobacter cryoconiti]|uniref:Uncharacterized protein n=1 Tax=Arthrobacter cryoconiti TaxID=748907 RepID=A0ABV8R1A7_9MICC|nr:hypothetical protein [Arthrobacter cryoconiti]MCC9068104.1 hypothetical protein [Arthrobacter cryoconiti]
MYIYRRLIRRIVITLLASVAFYAFLGSLGTASGGILKDALDGLIIGVAASLTFFFHTLDARTPAAIGVAAITEDDSVERKIFLLASSKAFVDVISSTAMFAAFLIVFPNAFSPGYAALAVVLLALADVGIRYRILWRRFAGA